MTSIVGARAAARTRLEASGSGITPALRFKGDARTPLPDTPAAFAYVVLNNEGSGPGPAAYGAGRHVLAEGVQARVAYKAYATGAITAGTQPTSSSDPGASAAPKSCGARPARSI
jgi:hypothetical protein